MRLVLVALFAVVIAGCSHHESYISAGVDPQFAPDPGAAVYLATPVRPSIRERQLLPVLRAELCRNGVSVADQLEEADFVLALAFDSETREFGTSTQIVVIPGSIPVAFGTTRPIIRTESTAFLYLVRREEFLGNNAQTVWEWVVSADANVFRVYQPIIFDNLINVLGRNFDGPVHLSKPYLREVARGAVNGC